MLTFEEFSSLVDVDDSWNYSGGNYDFYFYPETEFSPQVYVAYDRESDIHYFFVKPPDKPSSSVWEAIEGLKDYLRVHDMIYNGHDIDRERRKKIDLLNKSLPDVDELDWNVFKNKVEEIFGKKD